jgi:hypothetical protein
VELSNFHSGTTPVVLRRLSTRIILGDHVDFWDYRNDKRKSSYAVRHTYIDIGAGVPGWDDSEDGASGGVND